MAHEKIVTLFDSATQAEAAKKNLIKAGFPDHDISLISGERLQSEGKAIRHPSIWQRLFGDTVDRDYADVYSEAMENGGVILSLRAAEDDVAKAMTILYSHDSVDVPSRARRDVETKADQTGQQREFAGQTNDTQRDPVRTSLTGNESEEEILRLAQEHLEVGKRLVSEGSTRVRRYVVTDQVTEQVSLHEQHADIFRRAIDEPAYLGDIDWSEKTIEVAESHEQPVINKTARVKEEVVVRKDINDRVETVNDTVRRQEVDIDKAAATTQPRNPNLNEAGASTLNSANATGTQASTVPGTNVNTSKLDNNATQGKPTLGEKVSEKVSEVKDKVEGKSKQQNYDHTH